MEEFIKEDKESIEDVGEGEPEEAFGFAGSHHGGSGRGSIGNSRFSRGGNDSNARYRDFDGRVAMRNNDQQEEEMLDSWNACIRGGIHNPHHYSSRRGGRMNSPSVGGGDISPIRTFPMIEEDEEKDFGKSSEQLPLEKQTEIAVNQQQQIDDDKDFRGIDSNTIESNNPSPQNKQSPHHQHYSDDNDFRRSSIQQSHFNRSFSHEPLDDVSRPIMDKILEEEKLGLTRPPQQQHQRFDVPQQQTPHMGRGIRPFFRPRFQGPYHDQIGGQNFSQSQGPQAPQRQFHRNPHQQIGLGAPQPPQQQQQQPFFKKQQHSMNESSVPGHPLSPENLNQGSSEIE
uniref:Uncharacterized protein n=1 Tax=Meloidogyne javanica TaxID=6303 RepID=A0A915MKW9_MELJA